MDAKPSNYVCLSDLHLGARYSILSTVNDQGRYLSAQTSPSLQSMADCFREYIPKVFERPPTLVLLGDCLDFSFGTMTDNAQAFQNFIRVLFAENESPIFDDQKIIVIPGNHDHRLWQFEKDKLFISRYPDDNQYQTTKLFDSKGIPSYFLNSLVARSRGSGSTGPTVDLYYPNFGIKSPGGGRQVVLHHGHFVEGIYRLITNIHTLLGDTTVATVEQLERDNGGWIDFFWSSLGMSTVGKENAVLLFDIMQDPAATHQYSKKVAALICQYLNRQYGVYPHSKLKGQLTLQKLVTTLLDASFGRAFQTERMAYHSLLSAAGLEGVRWYLAEPLLKQIKDDSMQNENVLPTSFVFGHSHKPFQDRLPVPGFNKPVPIYNTGGWVVDEPGLTKQLGGAAVFIDSHCQVASLRLFQDPVNGEIEPVKAQGLGNRDDQSNTLLTRMRGALPNKEQQRKDNNSWNKFSEHVKHAIEQRAKEAREKFFNPESSTGL